MIIQLVISVSLIAIFLIVLATPISQGPIKLLVSLCLLAGTFITWNPDLATRLANTIGVGRGTDLILYLWILMTMLITLLFSAVLYRQRRMLTKITRTLALVEQRMKENGTPTSGNTQ